MNEVVITGLVTHCCVKATSLGAMEKGYQVVLVCDGHSNYSAGAAAIIEKWNTTINKRGAALLKTQEVDFGSR